MERYKSIFQEKRYDTFKAWFNPDSNWSYIFNSNLIHSEIALKQLKMDEFDALKKGYYRMYIYKNAINIESYTIPSEQQFLTTQYFLKDITYPAKIHYSMWQIENPDKIIHFPHQSFFFKDYIE